VTIAGGDITRAGGLAVSFTVVGWAADPGELVGRDGARGGDLVGVTGSLGGAGGGLAVVENRVSLKDAESAAALRRRYARPEPRLAEGRALAMAGASAMIDLSDGLAADAGHLGRASGVVLELGLASLPLARGVAEAAALLGCDAAEFAASAGEDYELCVCAPPGARTAIEAALASASRIAWIGRVTVPGAGIRPGVEFTDATGPLSGYEHSL
jgi:thiamine-monophosphate kinase